MRNTISIGWAVLAGGLLVSGSLLVACGSSGDPPGSGGGGSGGVSAGGDAGGSANASGGGGDGGGGQQAPTIEAACRGAVDRSETCFGMPSDYGTCVASESCFRAFYRDDAEAPLLACLATNGCGVSCEQVVAATLEFTPEVEAHRSRCAAFNAACPDDADADICKGADTNAPYWKVFDDAILHAVAPCLGGACEDLNACLADAVAPYLSCGRDLGGYRD